jgi:hypothetical protein
MKDALASRAFLKLATASSGIRRQDFEGRS